MAKNNLNTIFIISNNYWNLYNYRELLIKDLSLKKNVILVAKKDDYKNHFSNKKYDINFNNSLNIFNHLINLIKIYILIIRFKPETILNFTIFPMIYLGLISKFINCNSINTLTGLGRIFTKEYFFSKLFKLFIKFFVINAKNSYCFQNKVDERYFKLYFNVKKTYLVPGSGINLTTYRKFKEVIPNYRYTTFFMAARDIKSKGINEFLNAGLKCFDLKLKIKIIFIGNFNSLDSEIVLKVNKLIKSKEILNFEFVSKDKLINLIKKSDIVVLPSYYREGCPHILLEAMACNKPIIASVKNHSSQLIENRINGYTVGIKDTKQLTEIFKEFISLNAKDKLMMGNRSAKLVEKYRLENIINKYNYMISIK